MVLIIAIMVRITVTINVERILIIAIMVQITVTINVERILIIAIMVRITVTINVVRVPRDDACAVINDDCHKLRSDSIANAAAVQLPRHCTPSAKSSPIAAHSAASRSGAPPPCVRRHGKIVWPPLSSAESAPVPPRYMIIVATRRGCMTSA